MTKESRRSLPDWHWCYKCKHRVRSCEHEEDIPTEAFDELARIASKIVLLPVGKAIKFKYGFIKFKVRRES